MDKNLNRKTKLGLIRRIYDSQKTKSKKRGHIQPDYSINELINFILKDSNFELLYNNWVNSNYETKLKPSIDRLNDYLPYTLSNIRLTTWEENNIKGYNDRKNCVNTKSMRKIRKLDINRNLICVYSSFMQASRKNNANTGAIWAVCNNIKKTHKNFIWKYEKNI